MFRRTCRMNGLLLMILDFRRTYLQVLCILFTDSQGLAGLAKVSHGPVLMQAMPLPGTITIACI